jgi:two-component system NarL family sensor kinase
MFQVTSFMQSLYAQRGAHHNPHAGHAPRSSMRLKTKILLLAALPLLAALAVIAFSVQHQDRALAQRERALVERGYMEARRAELRHYVLLAASVVKPLHDSGRDEPATRAEAMRLLSSLDYGHDGYFFLYDLHGTVLAHSRQPELVGRNLWELRDPLGRPTIQNLIAQARAGGGYVEYLWRKPSSGEMAPKLGYVIALPRWGWMLGSGLYLDDIHATLAQLDQQVSSNVRDTLLGIAGIAAAGVAVISASGLLLNLSEHRVADAKLRLLARQVVQSQEDERAHLARELHDGTSQMLVSAKLCIESAVHELGHAGRAPPSALDKALQRLNDTLVEVRRISHRLRPALLDTLGLPAALEHLGREFAENGRIDARVAVDGEPAELPGEVKTALFRVTQEALTNVAKHAGATRVSVVVTRREGLVMAVVEDDGQGFGAAGGEGAGLGLVGMKERVGLLGGRLAIESTEGAGTTIVAEVPLA